MRRLFSTVPPSSLSWLDVQCLRRLSSPPIVAERHACHSTPRDALSVNNLGSCKYSRASVIACSNLFNPTILQRLTISCNTHISIVSHPRSCVKQRIEEAFTMLLILMHG